MDNRLINLKQGRDLNWPFNDPNYQCRVRTIEKTKIRADGSKVERFTTKHNVPLTLLPAYAASMMAEHQSTSKANIYVSTKSPLTPSRSNGKKKWFRPKAIRKFTKNAVQLIKDNQGSLIKAGIMNPISKRIPVHFTKMQIIFPQNTVK